MRSNFRSEGDLLCPVSGVPPLERKQIGICRCTRPSTIVFSFVEGRDGSTIKAENGLYSLLCNRYLPCLLAHKNDRLPDELV